MKVVVKSFLHFKTAKDFLEYVRKHPRKPSKPPLSMIERYRATMRGLIQKHPKISKDRARNYFARVYGVLESIAIFNRVWKDRHTL